MSPSPAALPADAEVVIVGGGIVGLCAALFLAREGRETLLLDRDAAFADASGLNAGTLSLQVKTPQVWALARLALELWARLDGEMNGGPGFTPCGGLRVALDECERSKLVASVQAQRAQGLDVDLLGGDELREQAPWLGCEVLAASRCTEDAYASPLLAGPALIQACAESDAFIAEHCAVTDMHALSPGFRVQTERGAVRCTHLLLAAGAATGQLCAMLDVPLPVLADLNMLHVTEPAGELMHGIVTHMGGMLSCKQYPNGTCVIGGGWQGRDDARGMKQTIDHENLHHNLAVAARVVPALAGLRLVRSWTGFEALVPDALPVAGAVPRHDGLYVAACARGGYTLGPAQALIVCEQIAGRTPAIDVSPFSPARLLQ